MVSTSLAIELHQPRKEGLQRFGHHVITVITRDQSSLGMAQTYINMEK